MVCNCRLHDLYYNLCANNIKDNVFKVQVVYSSWCASSRWSLCIYFFKYSIKMRMFLLTLLLIAFAFAALEIPSDILPCQSDSLYSKKRMTTFHLFHANGKRQKGT